jgi:hypothetical protein
MTMLRSDEIADMGDVAYILGNVGIDFFGFAQE